jgi:hypothetical protein
MLQVFSIFKTGKDGEFVLLETSETLEDAMGRVAALRESAPSDYVILSARTGKKITITATGGIRRD